MKKELKSVATTIDADILREFRTLVVSVYGQLHGRYKKELTEAIKDRIKKLRKGGSESEKSKLVEV